jgi:hypothetical protein
MQKIMSFFHHFGSFITLWCAAKLFLQNKCAASLKRLRITEADSKTKLVFFTFTLSQENYFAKIASEYGSNQNLHTCSAFLTKI